MSAKSSLPEDVIGPLVTISRSRSLEEALQFLIETSRTEIGRADLASNRILPFVLRLVEILQKLPDSRLLLLSMRLLRNLCAGETTNQDLFIEGNGTEVVSKCLRETQCSVPDYGLVRTALQVLANASLAGSKQQNSIWVHFFPSEFLDLAKTQSQQTIDPLCMIIYACCDGNEAFLVELCGDKGMNIVAEIVRTVSLVGFRENWFKLLLSLICLELPHLPTLFSKLYTAVDGEDLKGEPFTAAHAYLLSIVAEILNNRLEDISASTEFASFVLNINKKSAELIDFHSRGKSTLPTGSTLIDVFGYSLVILRDICAQEGGIAVDWLLSAGFLDLVLNLLSGLEPPAIVRKAENHVRNQEQVNSKVCPYKGFRRDIVGVIGNCLYQRKSVQDKIRDRDAIYLLLQQCVTDEGNPFLREWGIWSVRNLVLDNEENQKEVMELKIQGSVNVPEVSELGLRVEMNPETGRPKLVNCGPYDHVASKP